MRVSGDREAVAAEARGRASDGGTYASHNWDPLFVHGTKTIAFELFEQCGERGPDHLVLPVGYGSSLLGCHVGFSELLRNGAITHLPKLHAAQAESCAPLHLAFTRGASETEPLSGMATIASAIAASNPLRGAAMLEAIRKSRGQTVAVSEASIQRSQAGLSASGFYVEPSAAVAFAAAQVLRSTGAIRPDETTVVLLTGSGLKT